MKTCEQCDEVHFPEDRVIMGDEFTVTSMLYRLPTVLMIYLPILTWPFVVASALATYWHLRLAGAKNLRPLSSFLPDPASHRYHLKNQITLTPKSPLNPVKSKIFWIANCNWYCPYSVALFEWHAYLVKVVENWWCPFRHSRKESRYREGAINRSFWHLFLVTEEKLDPEDRYNPIWNTESKKSESNDAG